MANQNPCKKNDANGYLTDTCLVSQATPASFQTNPTLAAGDVKISIDDAAPVNLTTLPVVDADFTKRVNITLNQAETNGDRISIIFSDAAGAEWTDQLFEIHTSAQTFDELDSQIADAVWDEDITGHETADTAGRVQSAKMGEWEVTGNQLICKGLSGDVLFTFDLTQDGTPTEYNPDARVPV